MRRDNEHRVSDGLKFGTQDESMHTPSTWMDDDPFELGITEAFRMKVVERMLDVIDLNYIP